jgi:hypothetical protein
MSTKMSTDLNITRPTSRVIRAPGGGSSFKIGDDFPAPAPAPKVANSPVKTVPQAAATTEVVVPRK